MDKTAIISVYCLMHPGELGDQSHGGWVVGQEAWRVLVFGAGILHLNFSTSCI